MKLNVHLACTEKIAKKIVFASIIHRAIQKLANAYAIVVGSEIRAVIPVLKDFMDMDAKRNARTLFLAINRVIM